MRRRRADRGAALLLATLVIAALLTIASVTWLRLQLAHDRHPPQQRRLEALWLARSAAATRAGATRFNLGDQPVVINPRAGGVTVRIGSAEAVVEAEWGSRGPTRWHERFTFGSTR